MELPHVMLDPLTTAIPHSRQVCPCHRPPCSKAACDGPTVTALGPCHQPLDAASCTVTLSHAGPGAHVLLYPEHPTLESRGLRTSLLAASRAEAGMSADAQISAVEACELKLEPKTLHP